VVFGDPVYNKIDVNWYSPSICDVYFDDNGTIKIDNNGEW
jgi:hypothetical protein